MNRNRFIERRDSLWIHSRFDGLEKKIDSINPPKVEKLFGRYHDVVMIVLAFFLTTVAGSFITSEFQAEAQKEKAQATKLKEEKELSTEIFKEATNAVNERFRIMSEVSLAMRSSLDNIKPDNKHLLDLWIEYGKLLRRWNIERGTRRELLKIYFGNDVYKLERDIHYRFRHIGQAMECFMKDGKNKKEISTKISTLLRQVNPSVFRLGRDMAIKIKNEKIGSWVMNNSVKFNTNTSDYVCK